ncbi:hypothetical protein CKO24_04210 [Rhodothalassium salexigens DSM 2132]|nr:hypothetical protein [Rhodothalassium salexigens DSM 2132]
MATTGARAGGGLTGGSDPMTTLTAGLALFFGSHVASGLYPVRRALAGAMGEGAYKGLVTVASLAGIALMVLGARAMGFVPVYTPPAYGPLVPALLMPAAFILMSGAYSDPGMKAVVRHPFLWAIGLFAASHLVANGELSLLMVFGAFLVYAPLAMLLADAKMRARDPQRFAELAARSSNIPFAAWAKAPQKPKLRSVIVGLVLYVVVFWTHALVIGKSAAISL